MGLALLYTKQLFGMFQFCVRQTAEVENQVKGGFDMVPSNYKDEHRNLVVRVFALGGCQHRRINQFPEHST